MRGNDFSVGGAKLNKFSFGEAKICKKNNQDNQIQSSAIRGYFYNEVRYINLLFTYLLTYNFMQYRYVFFEKKSIQSVRLLITKLQKKIGSRIY